MTASGLTVEVVGLDELEKLVERMEVAAARMENLMQEFYLLYGTGEKQPIGILKSEYLVHINEGSKPHAIPSSKWNDNCPYCSEEIKDIWAICNANAREVRCESCGEVVWIKSIGNSRYGLRRLPSNDLNPRARKDGEW